MRARAVGLAAATTALLLVASGPASAAGHAKPHKPPKVETPAHALVHWINLGRAKAGLRPVSLSADLTAIANRHAAHMAKIDKVYHDPSLGSEVHGWRSLAEDVGSASRLVDLEHAFLSSPSDRVNLRTPGFRQLGVGVSVRDGLLYVTVIMRQPDGSARG
ncbi:hypothetical protein acdb102_09570 [Acidothermaceae bacterium B102]|nr:hypothetical protein acdb102_09570 [Acidothermaceae bacterium B102]